MAKADGNTGKMMIENPDDAQLLVVSLHAQGWSIRALSRHFKMGRNRIRRILRQNEKRRRQGHDALEGKKPIKRKSKLDVFKSMMESLLNEYPNITGVRMYEELEVAGFTGGKTIVADYLRSIRPKPKKRPIHRFETDPGVQGQMDWSPYTIDFKRTGKQQVLCFSYILGYSRRHYIDFTEDRKFFTLIRRHQDAFEYFGGVPRTCLYDGEKTVILRWEANQPIFNPAFVDFITHYLCRPIGLPPRTPQWKGKVEAPFQFVEKNLLNARTFDDLEHLRQTARWWMANRSDTHVHDTTRRTPLELFLENEQACLLPLPDRPYDTSEVLLRVCRVDGYLEHDTNLYSVPYEYVCDILTMKVTEHEILVYSPGLELIARHERMPRGAARKCDLTGHHQSKQRWGLAPVRQSFIELGDQARDFLNGLKTNHVRNCGFHARYILNLKEHYHSDDIHQALSHAIRYHAFDARSVERILKARFAPRTLESMRNEAANKQLENLPEIKQRPLSEYEKLFLKRSADETAR